MLTLPMTFWMTFINKSPTQRYFQAFFITRAKQGEDPGSQNSKLKYTALVSIPRSRVLAARAPG
jgi:hypothetical protein